MKTAIILLFGTFFFSFCTSKANDSHPENQQTGDTLAVEATERKPFTIDMIRIEKELLFDKYTLDDTYPYKDTTRNFQWDKIRASLFLLDSIQLEPASWGILQNYKNYKGEAPLVKNYKRNAYKRIADTLDVERYQSVPLYLVTDSLTPEIYGRDGSLVKCIKDTTDFINISTIYSSGDWIVPKKYIKFIDDTISFKKAIFVDRKNQNIATFEKIDSIWYVRSMNPATTGVHRPPYAQETPLGMFVLQEKKSKMLFLRDGSSEIGGFAPWANRFTNGAYVHGVPSNEPQKNIIEYSQTLGTTPRSHMCVRNASSHAKFIYDWAPVNGTIVFVLE